MKKICILSAVNIKHMSLISIYTKYFKENGMDYDVIYMDKYNEEENIDAKNIYRFYYGYTDLNYILNNSALNSSNVEIGD